MRLEKAISGMEEALAIREALLHAVSLNYLNICVGTDYQVFVLAISSRRRLPELHEKKEMFR